MIMEYQKRPFYKAEGIPRGGLWLANALNKYASGDPADQVLICDDVYTTGASSLESILARTTQCGQWVKVIAGLFLLENLVMKKIL